MMLRRWRRQNINWRRHHSNSSSSGSVVLTSP